MLPNDVIRRRLLDRMVLRPSRHRIDHGPQQRVMLRALGRPLECFVQQHRAADGERGSVLAIKFPGTSGRAEQSTGLPLRLLPDVSGTMWTWNPPGYGGSGGRASLPRIADAAMEYVTQVIDREADSETTIWLVGNSLGCASALAAASALTLDPRRVGIVLRNPPPLTEVVKRIARHYPLGQLVDRVAESVHARMNALVTAAEVDMPAVFIQSGADTLVPPAMQNQVIAAYRGQSRQVYLAGLAHDGVADPEQETLIQRELYWLFSQTYSPRRASASMPLNSDCTSDDGIA